MIILGIETSCDETAVALVEDGTRVLSNVIASSSDFHIKTGGIIPEAAARKQIEFIIPVLKKAVGRVSVAKIDAIAVTAGGPGLIGSMLVGVETAKTLGIAWNKPVVPVVHLLAHLYANFIESQNSNLKTQSNPQFPAMVLTVAGGHTDLILMKGHGNFEIIGQTRDDAAGETFDKTARILGLPYPGGPSIATEAARFQIANTKLQMFPRPMLKEGGFNFSFSGLKTAVARKIEQLGNKIDKSQIAAEIQEAIVDVLVQKTVKAAKHYNVKNILIAGGVAANTRLRNVLSQKSPIPVFIPPVALCTDNAAFIASYANFNYHPADINKISAIPDSQDAILYYENLKNKSKKV